MSALVIPFDAKERRELHRENGRLREQYDRKWNAGVTRGMADAALGWRQGVLYQAVREAEHRDDAESRGYIDGVRAYFTVNRDGGSAHALRVLQRVDR